MIHDVKTGEVLPPETTGALAHTPTDVLSILEQRDTLMTKVLDFAIKATHHEQWVDMQGKPFPTGAAAEVMARRCGVSVTDIRRAKTDSVDDKGKFYIYEYTATFRLANSEFDSIEAIGNCSSRDAFLGTETQKGRKLSEITEGDIAKAAYTDMMRNGITRLLGVRNLSWERLAALGINRDQVAKVEFSEGSKGGGNTMKFGIAKGKAEAGLTPDELRWYINKAEEDLKDEAQKERWNFRKKDLARWRPMLESKEKKAAEPKKTPPPADANKPHSPLWQQAVDLCRKANLADGMVKTFIDAVLQGKRPEEITESDVEAVKQALERRG